MAFFRLAAALLVVSCSLEPFDRTDFPCPCGSAYSCIGGRCVPDGDGGPERDGAAADTGAPPDLGELRAFPFAKGYGRDTVGGRGGEVMHVTNLENAGEGSLREALTASVPRTVVFDVSGYIALDEPITISSPYITVAGQSAPGAGVVVRGAGIITHASEVVLRYLRIRVGGEVVDGSVKALDLLSRTPGVDRSNVVVDHCSLSWAGMNLHIAGNGTLETTLADVTIQNSILSEPLAYRYNAVIDSHVSNLSMINNVMAHSAVHNPFIEYGPPTTVELINNVIFDYERGTNTTFGAKIDVIGNLYRSTDVAPIQTCLRYDVVPSDPEQAPGMNDVHQADNRCMSNPMGLMSSAWERYNSATRLLVDSVVVPIPSFEVEARVLADVGVGPVFADPVDARVLTDVVERTGSRAPNGTSSEDYFGGFPPLASEMRSADYDTDRDGMSNTWELEHGFDPDDASDSSEDVDGDGFTNLEAFLHALTL